MRFDNFLWASMGLLIAALYIILMQNLGISQVVLHYDDNILKDEILVLEAENKALKNNYESFKEEYECTKKDIEWYEIIFIQAIGFGLCFFMVWHNKLREDNKK